MTTDDRFASYTTAAGQPTAPVPGPAGHAGSRFDGGFFGPAPTAGTTAATSPANSPFGAPPASPFGTAPAPTPQSTPFTPVEQPPPGLPPGPPAPWASSVAGTGGWPASPPVRRGLPTWAIVLIAVGGFVALLVVAAVAIPLFLNQRDAAVHGSTSVSLTGTIGDLTQSADPALDQALADELRQLTACGCLEPAVGSGYQDATGTHRVLVVGARFSRAAHARDRAAFVRGFWHGARTTPDGALLGPEADQDPGALGGTLSCAPLSTTGAAGQMCVSVDAGAVTIVADVYAAGSTPDPSLPVLARESVEHRS